MKDFIFPYTSSKCLSEERQARERFDKSINYIRKTHQVHYDVNYNYEQS